MNTKNNLRFKTSNEKIETAFLSLILQKPFEEIQILDLCKKAEINRSTFYAHYTDIYELVINIESKFEKGIATILNFGDKINHETCVEMFNFIKVYKYFYKAFLSIPYTNKKYSDSEFLINLKDKNNTSLDDEAYLYYRSNFFKAGIKEIIRLWLNRDCEDSAEDMASLLLKEFKKR